MPSAPAALFLHPAATLARLSAAPHAFSFSHCVAGPARQYHLPPFPFSSPCLFPSVVPVMAHARTTSRRARIESDRITSARPAPLPSTTRRPPSIKLSRTPPSSPLHLSLFPVVIEACHCRRQTPPPRALSSSPKLPEASPYSPTPVGNSQFAFWFRFHRIPSHPHLPLSPDVAAAVDPPHRSLPDAETTPFDPAVRSSTYPCSPFIE